MISKSGSVIKIKAVDLSGKCLLSVFTDKSMTSVQLNLKENSGREFKFSFSANGNESIQEFCIDNPLVWSVDTPNLYDVNANLIFQDGSRELINDKFGVRNLTTNGKYIVLNNVPIYIRGYIRGIKCHDHENNCHLSDYEFYKKNIVQAKAFGFNFVRFHSTIPSEEFFRAADELGLLVHIELRDKEYVYDNSQEMTNSTGRAQMDEIFFNRVVNSFYNHPSLAVYCIGNEIKNENQRDSILELSQMIKRIDNTRLFVDTCAWGQNNREFVDIDVQHMGYYFPFGKHENMYEDTDNLLVCGARGGLSVKNEYENSAVTRKLTFNVPLLAHEAVHYCALRNFKALKEKFMEYKTPAPWWIDEQLKMIKAKGFEDIYDEMYNASKTFQFEAWKTAFESMRLSNILGGYHVLQFSDCDLYENSNGIVDCFDDISYATPEQFRVFNNEDVLLTKLGGRIFKGGTKIALPVFFSSFSERKDKTADFSYDISDFEGNLYSKGEMEKIDINRKGLYEICRIDLTLPDLMVAKCYQFKVNLKINGHTICFNKWKFWVYPDERSGDYNEFVNYCDEEIAVTDDFEKFFDYIQSGKKVCFVYRSQWTRHVLDKKMKKPQYAFKATWNRFKPVIWDRGTNFGGLCNTEILNKYGFTTQRFYDFNYSKLSEDCDKICLDDFPVKVKNLIMGIDKNCRDRFDAYENFFNIKEYQYDRTLRRFSYLFELKIGQAKVLICGLNLKGLDENEPSTVAMAKFIKSYMKSNDFDPQSEIKLKDFKIYLQTCAQKPVKERMMTQFWTMDDTPVESAQYWKESREYLLEDEK